MQPSRSQPTRGPGNFTPLSSTSSQPSQPSTSSRPALRRVDSSGSEDDDDRPAPSITIPKARPTQQGQPSSPATPIYAQFTSHANSSSASLQQHHPYPRPSGTRAVTQGSPGAPLLKNHSRKASATQGMFDSSLPSASMSNLSSHMGHHGGPSTSPSAAAAAAAQAAASASTSGMSASQIAAQAAVMSHQNSQQHSRQRSQTVPFPGDPNEAVRRGSGSKGPISPPMLSLTEASAPRDSGFVGHGGQSERFGTSHSSAATAAANMVFPRSGHNSPRGPQSISPQPYSQQPPPPPPASEKPGAGKAKVKLFSRPPKIGTKGDPKDKPLPSPGKIGSALSALQRGNFSTSSLVDPSAGQSMYSMNNSSSATIRPMESYSEEKERGKEKEKKHHFLSRQKNKLKDEYHLPLSSAASNSRPTDPNAPNPLYNFNVPASPAPNSASFAKAKKDKKLAERSEAARLESEGSYQNEWPGPSSLPSMSQQSSMYDPVDPGKLGLHNHMSLDDAWPYLKAKLLVIFEGEDLRLPVEDFNRVVQMHIQWCMHRRLPTTMLDDLRDLLITGFSSLDRTLRNTPEDRFIPTLVELWMFTFTSILPYMQAVFLPLNLEVSGCGTLMNREQSRDFWGGVLTSSASDKTARVTPAGTVFDVRRLVLIAYRDIVILPRYETLKTIFSRLSLEFLPSVLGNSALSSPPQEAALSTSPSESYTSGRPGTAMSIDPSVGSYNSTSTTLLGEGSAGGRSRAISNVSFGSHGSDGVMRPFTPSGLPPPPLGSVREREQPVDDSKHVTDMVGRMLQCMSVLSSLGGIVAGDRDDERNDKMVELCKMLKLNWLGRGRTGRNRRGIVGGRVRREDLRDELRVA